MVVMKKFIALFKKVGGWNMVKQYTRAHVLLYALVQTLLQGFSKKGLEIVRLSVNNKILRKLRKKYRNRIREYTQSHPCALGARSNKVWVCWLQGIEQAPPLVQRCFRSLQENLPGREIVLLTEDNYRDYVCFPAHVQNKIDSGVITRTHFSDLLRLELLSQYGGTWIDATVFCSGSTIPEYMLESDLFLFQKLKPGADGHCVLISSWFMTACAAHPIILLTRHLLYTYWKNHTKMLDYFLIHDFFQLAIEAYPQLWKQVIPFSSSTPHMLLLRLFDKYDPVLWSAITGQTPFHKLSYKYDQKAPQQPDTFYTYLMNQA